MSARPLNVLFPCTGNSCRGIMAECLLGALGGGRFKGHGAGSHPAGRVNPVNLALLQRKGHPTGALRSKSWDEFGARERSEMDDAPIMEMVITVCDNAAGEVCPVWPGHPVTARWPVRDPCGFTGPVDRRPGEYAAVYGHIEAAVRALVALPVETLDAAALKRELATIAAAMAIDIAGRP